MILLGIRKPKDWKQGVLGSYVPVKRFEIVEVECYAGYKGNETPRAFFRSGRRITVVEVLDRWYEGGISRRAVHQDYFRVLTAEGDVVILRYNHVFQRWSLMSGS